MDIVSRSSCRISRLPLAVKLERMTRGPRPLGTDLEGTASLEAALVSNPKDGNTRPV